jgi:hypothetical protein
MEKEGYVADETFSVFVEDHLLTERVEALDIFTTLLGLASEPRGALGDAADDEATGEIGEKREPLLIASEREGVQRKKKEVIKGYSADDCRVDGKRVTGERGDPDDDKEVDEAGDGFSCAEAYEEEGGERGHGGGEEPAESGVGLEEGVHVLRVMITEKSCQLSDVSLGLDERCEGITVGRVCNPFSDFC